MSVIAPQPGHHLHVPKYDTKKPGAISRAGVVMTWQLKDA